jgi:hypothetical protein
MGKVLELSEETHRRLMELARQSHRTPEEVIREFLVRSENEQYQRANQQMLAQGILLSLPTAGPTEEDDFEPEPIPGELLSETILQERR